jgi:hypothetical protein
MAEAFTVRGLDVTQIQRGHASDADHPPQRVQRSAPLRRMPLEAISESPAQDELLRP